MTESKKYKIRVFGYGYEGGITLSLAGLTKFNELVETNISFQGLAAVPKSWDSLASGINEPLMSPKLPVEKFPCAHRLSGLPNFPSLVILGTIFFVAIFFPN